MMRSIIRNKAVKAVILRVLAVVFWFAVWELSALAVDRELILPSPTATAARLFALAKTSLFWETAFTSLLRILAGTLCGIVLGTLLALPCARFRAAGELISPLIAVIRATPVASFILLVLIFLRSSLVPAFISMLMVTPILWSNVKTGIEKADPKLRETAKLYRLSLVKRWKMLYLPAALPYFSSACITACGLAWKAGIAAEILCTPKKSIGLYLYQSKLYLETVDLFAWTGAVIILSMLLETALRFLLKRIGGKNDG